MTSCVFYLYGIGVNFSTDNEDFARYVEGSLQNFKVMDSDANMPEESFTIQIKVYFAKGKPVDNGEFKLGNGIYIKNDNEINFDQGLFAGQFVKERKSNKLWINGFAKQSTTNKLKTLLKTILIPKYSFHDMLFHQLYRELVLLPVFWILRHEKGKFLMHASAISNDSGTYVFLGNDGVGKTTVAMNLLKEQGTTFYGDNFLLYDSNSIYPFVDTIRISKKDREAIEFYKASELFTLVYSGRFRLHYNFDTKFIANPNMPTKYFVLKQGKENKRQKLSGGQFITYSFAINDYVKEFDKYGYINNLVFLFETNDSPSIANEVNSMFQLVNAKPCELLTLKKHNDLAELKSLLN